LEGAGVVIGGAGIAGLFGARLLTEMGLKVLVLEAQNKVGGRMKTMDTLPGSPEAGGQTLSSMYARVFSELQALGLTTFERKALVPGDTLAIGGSLIPASEWETSPANPFQGRYRAMKPGRVYGAMVDALNPVEQLQLWPNHTEIDTQSVAHAMLEQGAGVQALGLMQRWFDGQDMTQMSLLHAIRKRMVQKFGGNPKSYRIVGGSQRLPEAMAASLGDAVRLNTQIVAISQDKTGVEMRDAQGGRYKAKHGLVALPLPALRSMALEPALPPGLAQAAQTLPYNAITLVILEVLKPFWEADGLPPQLYSDTLVQRVTAARGQSGGLPTLCCWLRNASADIAAGLDDDALASAVLSDLGRLRPASIGAVRVAHIERWDQNAYAGGAYHFFAPGQIRAFYSGMRAPWGRVRFIGEHMADYMQGMEGACESAEREAIAIIEAL